MSVSIAIIAAIVAIALAVAVWRYAALPCPVWLRWLVEFDNPFSKTNRAAYIVDTLALAPGMTVLDAGCGPGRVTIPLAQRVGAAGRVVAMDIQPGMLARARERAGRAGLLNIDFLEAGLGQGKLPSAHFDRAVLATVLGEIPDRQAALAELFDALVPGGRLAVVEIAYDPHFQKRSTVRRLAVGAGFCELAFFGHPLAYVMHFEKPGGAKGAG